MQTIRGKREERVYNVVHSVALKFVRGANFLPIGEKNNGKRIYKKGDGVYQWGKEGFFKGITLGQDKLPPHTRHKTHFQDY